MRTEGEPDPGFPDRQDFVDESVITALLTGASSASRPSSLPSDLALAADDMDFAGWSINASLPARAPESATATAPIPAARAAVVSAHASASPFAAAPFTAARPSGTAPESPFIALADDTPRPWHPIPQDEPGLGAPHSGNHRWWIAAAAGVLVTLILSILLIQLTVRSGKSLQSFWAPDAPAASPQPILEDPADASASDLTKTGPSGF